jgi:RNA polymerase sigma-70 factor, ECF subfamily
MQHKEDEPTLIALSLKGDHEAYRQLVDRYKNALYHHCFAMVRSEGAAEDIAQDTFITAYYKLNLYNADFRFSTWLFKIATNKSLNWLKKSAKEVAADDVLIASIASSHSGPEQLAAANELRAAVQRLRPQYRAVISLYYWQGLRYEEIAQVLSRPVGSVKGWMRRAKQELQQELS